MNKRKWEYKKLGAVVDFYRGLTYKREDEVDLSDNCVLRSNNIDLESMSLNFDELKYIRPDFVIPEDKKLKANSVFVCMSNGSKQHVGKVAYVKEDMDYAFGGFMGLIVPKREVEGKYIYYVCRSSIYRHFLTQIGNGIGITNLRFSDLNEFSIPFPSLSEQQHIVEELDLLSSIIEKKKAQLNELDNLAQSLFYEMFGDPITNEKGWEVKKLGEICSFSQGVQVDVSEQSTEKIAGWNRFLRIVDYTTDNDDIRYVNVNDPKFILNKDDIAMVRYGASVGTSGIGKEGVLANNLFKINYSKYVFNMYYLLYSFHTKYFKAFINTVSFGAAMPALSFKVIKDFQILQPPFSCQQSFASKTEAIEHQKELITQSIKEVETLFNSRMDYYFN